MKKSKNVIIKAIILSAGLITASFSASCSSTAYTNFGWSGSVVDNGTIYVASQGKLAALQKNNGSVIWQREIEKDTTSSSGLGCGVGSSASVIYANPVVVDGVVYVATYSGRIYAYSTASGNLLWKYPAEGYVQGIIGGLIIDNGVMYFAAVGGTVTAPEHRHTAGYLAIQYQRNVVGNPLPGWRNFICSLIRQEAFAL
jgi:outer membrane protein assembly factor BamB